MLLFLLISGCTSKTNDFKPIVNDKNAVTIELYNNKANFNLGVNKMSVFTDSVKFIILEETDESTINKINKIFFTQEQIIVVDRDHRGLGAIFFFDWSGKYIKKLSRRGQGPGEYISLHSCLIDEQRQQLIIYDIITKKMLFYDLSGNFIKEILNFSEGTIVRNVINLPDGHFLCYTFDCVGSVEAKYTGLWEVDANGEFLNNYFTYDFILPALHGNSSHLQLLSNEVIGLRDQIHSDIYHYHNKAVEKYISYDIKGSKLSQTIGTTFTDNHNIYANSYQEKGDYIITLWCDETFPRSQTLFSLFSKKNKEVFYWDAFYSYDTTIPGVMSWMLDSNSPEIIVCELNRIIIDEHLADKNLPEVARNALSLLSEKICESENPVLELLYIKK